MFHLVTGGSGSGKSAFAEDRICQYAKECEGNLFYIATMMPFGEETKRKIKRHRRMRADKGFQTIECYTGLEQLAEQGDEECPGWADSFHPCVLLECMSNLTANEIYQPERGGADVAERIIRGVMALQKKCRHLVIVTNEVCSECTEDSEEMQQYKQILAAVNVRLAEMADEVTEVVYGMPCRLKGVVSERQSETERADRKTEAAVQTADAGYRKGVPDMKLVIGGAHQGKLDYAKRTYVGRQSGTAEEEFHWIDGKDCSFEEVYTCGGIYNFELLIKRMMENGEDISGFTSLLARKNPEIVIVSTEIGYGLVPIDAFDREYREQTGRICTQLAELSSQVDRVVCGIGITLKGE